MSASGFLCPECRVDLGSVDGLMKHFKEYHQKKQITERIKNVFKPKDLGLPSEKGPYLKIKSLKIVFRVPEHDLISSKSRKWRTSQISWKWWFVDPDWRNRRKFIFPPRTGFSRSENNGISRVSKKRCNGPTESNRLGFFICKNISSDRHCDTSGIWKKSWGTKSYPLGPRRCCTFMYELWIIFRYTISSSSSETTSL